MRLSKDRLAMDHRQYLVQRRHAGVHPDPLINTGACKAYAAEAEKGLDAWLAKEKAGQ